MSSAALSTRSRVSAHALSFYTSLSAPSVLGERQEVDRRGFLKSESRAGGPVLCSIPARYEEISTRYDHHVAIRRNRVEIQNMVEEILEGLRIEYMRVVVCGRRSKVQPEAEPIPTVLVVMPTPSISQAQSWYNTAKEIHRKLDRRFRGISVELIERRLNRGFRCDPVHSTHSLYQKWERIVCSILRTSDVREWMIVECWHFGTESDPALNPVTLIVSVQATSTSRFTTSARRIHGILTNNNEADVNVLFVKDQTTKLTENPTVPWQACNQYVQPGISLGIHNSCAESSTLGGLVQLKHKNDPIWHTYAMTCFHCVWPEPKYRADLPVVEGGEQALSKWQWQPMKPTGADITVAEQMLRIDHPSLRDLNNTIISHNTLISEYKDTKEFQTADAIQKRIDKGDDLILGPLQRNYDSHVSKIRALEEIRDKFQSLINDGSFFLGHVYAGSGMNRIRYNLKNAPITMDWALVEIGSYRLRTEGESVVGNVPFNYTQSSTDIQEFLFVPGSSELFDDEVVFRKSGRSTGITQGRYSHFKSCRITQKRDGDGQVNHIVTWEHVFTSFSRGQPFAEPGDFGAWVYSSTGYVFGMLFRGSEAKDTYYVSDMSNVFDDILEVTGAEEIRIA